jgi:hypothetical protein
MVGKRFTGCDAAFVFTSSWTAENARKGHFAVAANGFCDTILPMPRWVLPLLILLGLYVLSVNPFVAYFSRGSGASLMVPTWLRTYGAAYLWAYDNSPKQVQNLSDGYLRWCVGHLAKSEQEIEKMKGPGPPPLLPMGR